MGPHEFKTPASYTQVDSHSHKLTHLSQNNTTPFVIIELFMKSYA